MPVDTLGMNETIDHDDAPSVVNIAGYKFVALQDLPALQKELKSWCQTAGMKGTILLSPEGINLFLAAPRNVVDDFLAMIRRYSPFADLEVKESPGDDQPFSRMLVRLKKEIIAFGVEGIDPVGRPAPKLPAQELKRWLDDGQEVVLLDTRNDYEVDVGTFENALPIGVDHFRDFPAAVQKLDPSLKQRPIVMFCTGGIRCEKAGPYMEQQGFEKVYQLDGGILKYFEEVGGAHWNGECFVFDKRVAVNPHLEETATTQCYACQHPLTPEDQESPHYIAGEQCPFCYQRDRQRTARAKEKRQQALRKFSHDLPGREPYTNVRPLNVPQRFAGHSLLEFVNKLHPHMGSEFWEQAIHQGRLQLGYRPLAADFQVTEGMMIRHLIPDTIEPEVNADIQILHEDAHLVVVHKPAPLPAHPSGRFHRHTLFWMLQQVYQPEKLRAVHRLDADTSGVMVVARKRRTAAAIAPQFQSGQVEKTYLAVVHGIPQEDEFSCTQPISESVGEGGVRGVDPAGLPAETHFRVLQRLDNGTALVQAMPRTGRTHQIRIHLWTLGFPIVGDPTYLPQQQVQPCVTLEVDQAPMQLHAWKIQLQHPESGEPVVYEAPLPAWATSALSLSSTHRNGDA